MERFKQRAGFACELRSEWAERGADIGSFARIGKGQGGHLKGTHVGKFSAGPPPTPPLPLRMGREPQETAGSCPDDEAGDSGEKCTPRPPRR